MRPDNLKALYRRGMAYCQLGKLEEAEEDLKRAQQLDPAGNLLASLCQVYLCKRVQIKV